MGRGWEKSLRTSSTLLGVCVASQLAFAREPPLSELAYDVPAECPDRAAWLRALGQRLAEHPRKAGLWEQLEVTIERQGERGTGSKYTGQLRARGVGHASPDVRRVRGATCAEVIEALTLIAALSLEPSAPDAEPREAPSAWSLSANEELELARDPATPVAASASEAGGLRIGAAGLALWGGAASAGLDLDLGLALTARWSTPDWQPWLSLGFYAGGERVDVSGTAAGARLERFAAHAVACPVRFPESTPVGVRPCVDLDVGRLSGEGIDVYGATRQDALWASLGAELRAEWAPFEALELSAMVGGIVALSRPRFYFLPETTAFEANAAALRVGTTASVSF